MHGSARRHYLHVTDFRNTGRNPLKQRASKPWHIALSVRKVRYTNKNVSEKPQCKVDR